MTQRERDDSAWHLDKKVPISLIMAIVVQSASFFWWAAATSEKVSVLKERLDAIAPQANRLTRVEVNIESIKDSLTEIKQALRRPREP
jgi:Tfp pilus assembly protein PilO